MYSRRRFLAALSVSVGALAGCNDRGGETDTPPETSSDIPSPTRQPTESETRAPEPTPTETGTATSSPTATPDPMADRFGTIRDVTDHGIDASGSQPIDETFHELVDDDTLLRFPSGSYRVDELRVEDVTNFGMVGDDARLVLGQQGRAIFLGCRRVSDLLVAGFTVDATATDTVGWCDVRCTGGDNVVRDYTLEGFGDVQERTNGFTLMVEGSETSLELDRVDLSDGAVNGAATFVFPRREFYEPSREAGSITFRDCVMSGWGKEGLYGSAHEGPIRVIGGEYANNAIVQVRVGGGGSDNRAVVRDVSVTVDQVPDYMPEYNTLLRGIWLKEGDRALVENCDVTVRNVSEGDTPGGIIVNDQFGRATIRDCSVTVDGVSRPALVVERPTDRFRPDYMPSMDALPTEWAVTVENLTVDGASPDSESVRIGFRDDCTIRGLDVEKAGGGGAGLELLGVTSCTIEDASVRTSGYPVVLEFDDETECVLSLSNVSLSTNGGGSGDSRIASADDGTFCVGSDALPGVESPDDNQLALTRTVQSGGSAGDATPRSGDALLYGRWLT